MKTLPVLLLLLCSCSLRQLAPNSPPAIARPPASKEDDVAVYFSPHGGAMAAVLRQIDQAQGSIDVLTYLLTSKQIVEALEAAGRRGVRVRIVLDKHNPGAIFSNAAYFKSRDALPVWRDGAHKDMHNKVMLIDDRVIITGSFNFTDQSEEQNAENLLIIHDKPKLFAAYLANFEEHLGHSDPPRHGEP